MIPFALFLLSYIRLLYALPTSATDETVRDAARIARYLISSSAIGTMATSYPPDHPSLPGFPFSLQEYYASCYNNGSLLLLFLPISRHSQNILHSPKHAASISVWSSPHPSADRARVSLIGNVTILGNNKSISRSSQECYLEAHPDAERWSPNEPDSPHSSFWARFDPAMVYFVGGFGDLHYIGEIPLKMYQHGRQESSGPNTSDELRVQL